jgi:alpha-maltose-1-phosphate synthase
MKELVVCVIQLTPKGGMMHYASELANGLSDLNNVKVHMLVQDNADCAFINKKIHISKIEDTKKHPFNLVKFIKQVDRIHPDVIHITSDHPWNAISPCLKSRANVLVYTIHDPTIHKGDYSFSNMVSPFSRAVLLTYTDRVIVHGDVLKTQLMRRHIKETKIVVIPHGSYSMFKNSEETYPEEDNLLFFGRILEYKGLEYLIKAKSLITGEFPDIKVVIAGEGDLSRYENSLKEPGFEVINSYIPDNQVAKLFQKSKIVVLPYIEASQSGVVAIANAFGKPVVATTVGAIPEAVEDRRTGILVPPRDEYKLAEAIKELLRDDGLRREMGNNAYKKSTGDFSWSTIARKTLEVYEKALLNKK